METKVASHHGCLSSLFFLADSGACYTLIDVTCFNSIDDDHKTPLVNSNVKLTAADGGFMKILGSSIITLHFGETMLSVPCLVTKLPSGFQAILGSDFMKKQNIVLDMGVGQMSLAGQDLQLFPRPDSTCYTVVTDQEIILSPDSTMKICGLLCDGNFQAQDMVLIEEHACMNKLSFNLVDSVCEVDKDSSISTIVKFEISNHDCQELVILPHTPVAMASRLIPGETIHLCSQEEENSFSPGEKDGDPWGVQFAMAADAGSHAEINDANDELLVLPDRLQALFDRSVSSLSPDQKRRLKSLLIEYQHVFSDGISLPACTLVTHKLQINPDAIINERPRRYGNVMADRIEQELDRLLAMGVLRYSQSQYNSPIVAVRKKCANGSEKLRIVQDTRVQNLFVTPFRAKPPNIADLLTQLAGSSVYICLDLANSFWQIALHEDSKKFTAFTSPRNRYLEFNRMSQGCKNSSAVLSQVVALVLKNIDRTKALSFVDDMILHAADINDLLNIFEEVLSRLSRAQLTLQPAKCELFKTRVCYLGVECSKEGLRPSPSKIIAVQSWIPPRSVKGVRSFIGFCSFYRRWIPSFSRIASPMINLTKLGVPFVWSAACQEAFESLKGSLCKEPLINYPSSDPDDRYCLEVDASSIALGATLNQYINGKLHTIEYCSKALNKSQSRYCSCFLEFMSVWFAIKHWRHYLFGHGVVTIKTDCSALRYLLHSTRELPYMLQRWLLDMADIPIEVIYIRGKLNKNVDALSRKEPISKRMRCKRRACRDCGMLPDHSGDELHSNSEDDGQNSCPMESELDALRQLSSPVEASEFIKNNLPPRQRIDQGPATTPAEIIKVMTNCDMHITEASAFMIHSSRNSSCGSPTQCDQAEIPESQVSDEGSPVLPGSNGGNRIDSAIKDKLLFSMNKHLPLREIVNWTKKFSAAELRILQLADPDLKIVISQLESEVSPPPKEQRLAQSKAVRNLWTTWKFLCINQGVLYRFWCPKDLASDWIVQFVVPDKMRQAIFQQLHAGKIGAHFGQNKMQAMVRQNFYWPFMKSHIKEMCRVCVPCCLTKLKKGKRSKLKPVLSGYFNQRVHIDFLKLPISERGNQYALVLICAFSKLVKIIPCQSRNSQLAADSIITHWVCQYGAMETIISDREFSSNLFLEMCKALHIERAMTTSNYPQCNGLAENANKTILTAIRCILSDTENSGEWDEITPFLELAMNSSKSASTGFTPFKMVYASEATLPVHLQYKLPSRLQTQFECPVEYVNWLTFRLSDIHDQARRNLKVASLRAKGYYDKHVKPYAGMTQCAFRFIPNFGEKTATNWVGPIRIWRRLSSVHYACQHRPGSKLIRLNVSNLAPFHGPLPKVWEGADPPPELNEDPQFCPQGVPTPGETNLPHFSTSEDEGGQNDAEANSDSNISSDQHGQIDDDDDINAAPPVAAQSPSPISPGVPSVTNSPPPEIQVPRPQRIRQRPQRFRE